MSSTLALIVESILLILLVPFAVYGLYNVICMRTAPYVRTASTEIDRMLKLAGNLEGRRTLELGSGNGEVSIRVALAGAHAHGIEANPALIWWSRIRSRLRGVGARTDFHRENFFRGTLDPATDVVFLYLLPEAMQELLPKLRRDLKPGTIIISNAFEFKECTPERQDGSVRRYVLA
jgi:predicted O-methyltransferase YrrM